MHPRTPSTVPQDTVVFYTYVSSIYTHQTQQKCVSLLKHMRLPGSTDMTAAVFFNSFLSWVLFRLSRGFDLCYFLSGWRNVGMVRW